MNSMGLFSKKKDDYEEASKGLNQTNLASDRIIMEQMVDDDMEAKRLVDSLKDGNPLIINFEGLDPFVENKMLAFMTGATVALDGKVKKINDTTYLFARRVDFIDGSLMRFLDEIPRG